jgi:hypothetical protein
MSRLRKTIGRRLAGCLAAAAIICSVAVPLQATVVISEFMAANGRTLRDRDRAYSDWIELFNAGASAVNLEGWSLTDSPDAPAKWRFPSVAIAPNGYLVVFASGKNRTAPEGELHTNFKLKAKGDYLALMKPDGKTVASRFAPAYPVQTVDASYGIDMSGTTAQLITEKTAPRFLIPAQDPGAKWKEPEFDDSRWNVGAQSIGFDRGTNYGSLIETDVGQRMFGNQASSLLRYTFVVNDDFDRLRLGALYDDGFVAYLNGSEIARRNAPAALQWNSAATVARGPQEHALLQEDFESESAAYVVDQADAASRPKASVPNVGSSGRFLRLINGRRRDQVNSVTFPRVSSGPFDSLTAEFDFRCRSSLGDGDAIYFLVFPTAEHGATGSGISLSALEQNKDANFPGVLAVRLRLYPPSEPTYLAVHWDKRRRIHAPFPTAGLPQRIFHRASIRLKAAEGGAYLTVAFRSNVNTPGGREYVAINNAFIPEFKPFDARVEIAARIGESDRTIDLDNVRLDFTPRGGGGEESFEITGAQTLLRRGKNVLAVHALNSAPKDPRFIFRATLLGQALSVDPKTVRYFAQATPARANGSGLPAVSKPPIFSVEGGAFTSIPQIELKAKSPETEIRYTLDGSEPGASSPLYTEPIALNRSALVKARAFTKGLLPSPTLSHAYTLVDESLGSFTSNLPLVILNTFGQYVSRGRKTPMSVRFIDPGNGRSRLLGEADFDGRGDVNVRGFSSLRYPRRSYTLRIRDAAGDKEKVPILGFPKESDWILYAPYADKTLMRDALAYELSNKMGRYAPRTRFVEVFVHGSSGKLSPRDYVGVYVFEERITRDKKRVNVEELTPADNAEPAISGGYIIKRDHYDDDSPDFMTSRGIPFFLVEPKKNEITPRQRQWIARYMDSFERALYGSNFRDPEKGYRNYLDVDAFIDQHWLIEVSKNIDGFRYSAYVHKDRGGKLVAGPAWDWNLSFGNADYHGGDDPARWYTDLLRENELCWFRRLNDDADFVQRVVDRWAELREDVLNPQNVLARVDEMAAQLEEAQRRNFQRWAIMGRRIHPNSYVGRNFENEVGWMKQWISRRIAWIDGQFLSAPAASRKSGALSLHAPSGKIYYTVDGSDPRASGGGVSSRAKAYNGSIPWAGNATIMARAHDGRRWSGLKVVRPGKG